MSQQNKFFRRPKKLFENSLVLCFHPLRTTKMPEANSRITPKLKRHQQKRTNLFIKVKEYQVYKINGARQKNYSCIS